MITSIYVTVSTAPAWRTWIESFPSWLALENSDQEGLPERGRNHRIVPLLRRVSPLSCDVCAALLLAVCYGSFFS